MPRKTYDVALLDAKGGFFWVPSSEILQDSQD